MRPYENWIVAPYDENIYSILHFLLHKFSHIFGTEVMNMETCTVFNDPSSPCPMLITNKNPVMIRLSQESTRYWAQTVYQLSHEMCHYAIRQRKTNKDITLKWLEETICEAVSLYALEFASKNWYRCPLSSKDPSFATAFSNYLGNELIRAPRTVLRDCVTFDDLKKCDDNAEEQRDGRLIERNFLYSVISKQPEDCLCFCDMYRYLNEDQLTIDFDKWLADNPSAIVQCLSQIQPKIAKN